MTRITVPYKKVFLAIEAILISVILWGCAFKKTTLQSDTYQELQQSEVNTATQTNPPVLNNSGKTLQKGSQHFLRKCKTIDISELTAREFIIFDEKQNAIVYGKNIDSKIQAASITKLLSVLTALDFLDIDEIVPIGEEIRLVPEGTSKANLPQGDSIKVSDLVKSVLIPSGADAVYVLAVNTARRETKRAYPVTDALVRFAELMNKKALDLGMTDSFFSNPVGLDSGEEAYNKDKVPYTTASDILLLVRAAYNNNQVREAVCKGECIITLKSGKTVLLSNTNLFVNKNSDFYNENVVGMKTGYTDKAGRCLVLTVVENKRVIFILLFGYKTAKQLYSEADNIVGACLPTISSQDNAR